MISKVDPDQVATAPSNNHWFVRSEEKKQDEAPNVKWQALLETTAHATQDQAE
jgi:hypothetical protein